MLTENGDGNGCGIERADEETATRGAILIASMHEDPDLEESDVEESDDEDLRQARSTTQESTAFESGAENAHPVDHSSPREYDDGDHVSDGLEDDDEYSAPGISTEDPFAILWFNSLALDTWEPVVMPSIARP